MLPIIQPIPNKRITDLTGTRCGRLTIIGFAGLEVRGKKSSVGVWWAQCDCGSEPIKVVTGQWNRAHHVSCGCKKIEQLQATKIELLGQTFGQLLVITSVKGIAGKSSRWICKCSCGKLIETSSNSLRQGLTKSCGCLQKAIAQQHMYNYLYKYRIERGFSADTSLTTLLQTIHAKCSGTKYATKNRDGFKCVLCGSTKKLNSHHIIPIHENKELANDPNNIITLCTFCHYTKAHITTKSVCPIVQKQLQDIIESIK